MESHAISRAERRIRELESAVQRLRLEMGVREMNGKARRMNWETDLFFRLWMAGTLGVSALLWINVPTDKAKAVIDAMERETMDKIATRDDLTHVQQILSKDMDRLEERVKSQLATLETRLTVRLGSIAVILNGVLSGLLKLTS